MTWSYIGKAFTGRTVGSLYTYNVYYVKCLHARNQATPAPFPRGRDQFYAGVSGVPLIESRRFLIDSSSACALSVAMLASSSRVRSWMTSR